jgi:hypothetical protein
MDRPIGNTPEVHAECEKWYVVSWKWTGSYLQASGLYM